ncbi:MAG: molybdate ABC transporter permease subunit [Xanthomonadales bacterium]|nr:molybdate ABC transporter permease subunit [Xanthomonadales bacterium]
MFSSAELTALALTLKLALVSTIVLLVVGIPLAWWLARTRWRFRFLLDAIIALPLVLPPTVLGFYLLLALGPSGPLGRFMDALGGHSLAFSFSGLVIGSVIYSLPFVVQPIQQSFIATGRRPMEVAASLGAAPLDRFFSIALPLARPGILTGAALGFAHTLGEFGVVLMIGGSIPGETRVVSIAIYEQVESLQYTQAHWLSGALLLLSLVLLALVYRTSHHFRIGPS